VAETQERDTPLQIELKRLAKWLSVAVIALVALMFCVGIAFGRGSLEMFQMAVALAVAAIPEGLGISVTIVLAIGMQRMSKHNALTRRLIAAETLGSVSVICTDKTGTITEGEMRVDEITGNRERMLEAMMLCNDAVAEDGKARGTPTERALLDAALQAGLHPIELSKRFPRLAERPFDSVRKYMATIHVAPSGKTPPTAVATDGRAMMIVKGAPERVIPMCRESDSERLEEAARLTEGGQRVIAIATKTVSRAPSLRKPARMTVRSDGEGLGEVLVVDDGDLRGLTLLGFVGLRDPLRKEAAEQIRAAREAGVRTVIVTGDHPNTARAIAEQAGVPVKKDSVATGEELDRWDDAELDRRVHSVSVYARVEPRHKIRVVQAWQRRGAVVAVTGDGVNDAPALRAADVGVALGSGTEVAKEASDIVLLDNNLASITSAIREGRVMFDNMRRSVVYLFTSGFTEMVLIGGALLFGLPLPLLPAQILWINLVADTFPNAALAFEKGEPDIMRIPPRPRGEPVFNRRMAVLLLVIGVVTDVFLFGLYFWVLGTKDVHAAQSFMFAAVGVASVIYVFAIRSFHRSIFRMNPFSNPLLLAAVALSLGLMVLALTFPPLAHVLQVTPLSLSDWSLLLMIGVLKLGVIETAKQFAI
jgi:Ca2+-transporting ATPase